MRFEKFTKEHYPILVDWWTLHKHPVLPFNMLSPIGLISFSNQDEAAAASFIYLVPGADIAQIAWTTTNPNVSARDRYESVEFVIQGLIGLAKNSGRSNILCFSNSRGLNRIFAKQGLQELKEHKLMYKKLGAL